jgi:hypothetical protein
MASLAATDRLICPLLSRGAAWEYVFPWVPFELCGALYECECGLAAPAERVEELPPEEWLLEEWLPVEWPPLEPPRPPLASTTGGNRSSRATSERIAVLNRRAEHGEPEVFCNVQPA